MGTLAINRSTGRWALDCADCGKTVVLVPADAYAPSVAGFGMVQS